MYLQPYLLSNWAFRNICIKYIWGQDLYLSGSRDQSIHHMPFPIGTEFLESISNRFRDIRPQKPMRAHAARKWFYILSHAMDTQ